MADRIWLGTATPVAKVQTWAFGGTWLVGETITVTVGYRAWTYTLASATIATFLAAMKAAYNALEPDDYPEMAEMTADSDGTDWLLAADTPGLPFAATLSTNSADGTIDSGASSTGTETVASAGPNHWDTAANWTGGAVPVDSDNVYFENSSVSVLYGLEQSDIQPTLTHFRRSYTGAVGLPRWNETGGYPEYRTGYLQIESVTLIVEADSGRIKIDATDGQTAVQVLNTGSPAEEGVPAFLFKGTHADNTLEINKGSVGVAVFAGETATLATLRVNYTESVSSDVSLIAGVGLTLATLHQSGGKVDLSKSPTTVTQIAGSLVVRGTTTATTLTIDGGETWWLSSGTITTLNVGNEGVADFSRDTTPRTVTNCNVYHGGTILDPSGSVTFTNGVQLQRTTLDRVNLDLGFHRKYTPGSIS